MILTKEVYVDLQEKYEKVKKLIEEDSKLDPENEPYISKYNARQILIGMKANLENLLRTQSSETHEKFKLIGMLGIVYLYLCTTSIETEEVSVGEKYLLKCQEVIDKYESHPEVTLVYLSMLNELGLLWSEREPEKAKMYLEKAEAFYKDVKETDVKPVDIQNLFVIACSANTAHEELGLKSLEKLHTLTLYYLAQIYGALKEAMKSAVYCHTTLRRQLQSGDYENIDWALNSATLSQFFMENNGFKQARHHLAASSCILHVYEKQLAEVQEQSEEHEAKLENFQHRSADVARCWAKYGLLLLGNSRDRLLNNTEDIDKTSTLTTDLGALQLNCGATADLNFPDLNLTQYEEQITDQFILTIEDARQVFQNVKNWLEKAQTYYTLNNLASDYIEIVQDQAQLYSILAFFEENPENQSKMYKRRVDLFEELLKQVNPKYYMRYCKQMWYELAQAYSEILHIKIDKLRESNSRPNPQALLKINTLVDKAIQNFNNFINSFKEASLDELPKSVDKEYEKLFLQAYFHIAALNSRYITLDKHLNVQHVEASLDAYKKLDSYCRENVDSDKLIPTEITISREMITLLPVKIVKLSQEIG